MGIGSGFPTQEDLMADFASLKNLQNNPEAKVAFPFPASDFQKLSLQESFSGASTQCPGGSFGNINFPGSFDSSIGTGDEFSPSSSLASVGDQKMSLQESFGRASTQCQGSLFGNINFTGVFDSSFGTGEVFSSSSSLASVGRQKISLQESCGGNSTHCPGGLVVNINLPGSYDSSFGTGDMFPLSSSLASAGRQKISLQESCGGDSTHCPGGIVVNVNLPGSYDSSFGTGDMFSPSSSLASAGRQKISLHESIGRASTKFPSGSVGNINFTGSRDHSIGNGEVFSPSSSVASVPVLDRGIGGATRPGFAMALASEMLAGAVPPPPWVLPPGLAGICMEGLPSIGSKFHHVGDCMPGKFFRNKRGCKDVEQCSNCHLPHEELTYSGVRRVCRLKGLASRHQELAASAEAPSPQAPIEFRPPSGLASPMSVVINRS
mmetsp:Transcript_164494/g.527604  ORF Transcript_164494/g.527604 Transcript_164494/m.527604 type:complete len:435 (-) Transcript_164494:95-1399(-)